MRARLHAVAGAGAGVVAVTVFALASRSHSPSPARAAASTALSATAPSDPVASVPSASAAPPEPPPRLESYNVIFITIDTLRADQGFAGYPRPVTPNLDELAARSTVFETAYSLASYTSKSIGSMIIGRYCDETMRDPAHYTTYYPANVFMAERAQAAGVRTLGGMCQRYFKWPTGLSEGFDVWDTSAIAPNMEDDGDSITSDRLTRVALDLLGRPQNTAPSWDDDAGVPADADTTRPRRFLAWFHYYDPHWQYVHHEGAPDFSAIDAGVPARRDLYDEDVWFTDQQIGEVLDYVAEQPWAEETAIIVTADHGEAFGEHGFYKHGHELWQPLIRVPLIVYVPGQPARRVPVKRSAIDIAPTILDLLDVPVPEGALRGKSLMADVLAPPGADYEERDVYVDMPKGPYNELRRALVYGPTPGMKLISYRDERYELYDLASDPGEEHDLSGDADKRSEAVARLKALRATLDERPPWQ